MLLAQYFCCVLLVNEGSNVFGPLFSLPANKSRLGTLAYSETLTKFQKQKLTNAVQPASPERLI